MNKELRFVLIMLVEISILSITLHLVRDLNPEIVFMSGAITILVLGLMGNLYTKKGK